MTEQELRELAGRYGFARAEFCAPEPFARWRAASAGAHRAARSLAADPHAPAPWARAICIAAAPYPFYRPANGVSVAAYYVCYNAVHAAETAFVAALNAQGVQATSIEIPLKPAAERAGLGVYGRNGLIQVAGLGSMVMLRCVALGSGFEGGASHAVGPAEPFSGCGSCRRCIEACPSGALSEKGFDYTRCLRAHMLQGQPVPEELRAKMGGRLLGCEECLRACPHNAAALYAASEPPAELKRVLDIKRALDPDAKAAYFKEYGALLGWNYAIPNRVIAQAIIVAANLHRTELSELIERLSVSKSEAVSAHARWAIKKLNNYKRQEAE